jgi:dTDP-4-dehydrorhamnose reductase
MTRFLVTGASGLLGINFGMEFAAQSEVIGTVNHHALVGAPFKVIQADLRQPDEVDRVLDQVQPDVVMNCAALAILDECETRPDQAERVNTRLPLQLAVKTAELKIRLVHISTDSVFDGRRGDYTETDRPNPLSVYAMTKLEGERAVLDANPDALVARVNFYGWSLSGQRSLSEFFFRHLSQGAAVKGFTDVFFCPLQVNELARLLARMAELELSGLYHVVSSECMSKYDFGVAIARQFDFDEKLVLPTSVQDSGLKAPRSPRLTLRTEKAAAALGATLPGLQPGLEKYYRQWADGYTDQIRLLGKAE